MYLHTVENVELVGYETPYLSDAIVPELEISTPAYPSVNLQAHIESRLHIGRSIDRGNAMFRATSFSPLRHYFAIARLLAEFASES